MIKQLSTLQKKPGTALVLSGGATKAFYFHLGVLKVLHPDDISSIVGSSAGAVIGAFIASGVSVDTLLNSLYEKKVYLPKFNTWVKTLTSSMLFRPRLQDITLQSLTTALASLKFLLSLPTLCNKDIVAEAMDTLIESQSHISGFFDAGALEELFQNTLPSAEFSDMDIDLYVTATCLDCHQRTIFNGVYSFEDDAIVFMDDVPVHRAVRASTAIPGMFEPVLIKGSYYVDGEIMKTLSADLGLALSDKVVVSHTYQPLYTTGNQSIRDMGWVNILKQTTSIIFRERIEVWRELYEQQFPDKAIIFIQPEPDDVEFFLAPEFSFRPEVQQRMIASGEIAALKALDKTPV